MRARRYAYSFFDDDAPRKEALAQPGFVADTLGAAENLQRTVTLKPIAERVTESGVFEGLDATPIAPRFGTRTRYAWGLFDDESRLEAKYSPSLDLQLSDTVGLSETLDAEATIAPIVETFDLNETLTAGIQRQTSMADAVAFSETLTAVAITRNKSGRSRRFAYLFFDDEPRIGVAFQTGGLSETLDLQESLDLRVNKLFAETATLTEAMQQSMGKALSETAGLAESDAYAIARAISETAGLTEGLATALIHEPSTGLFFETVNLAETFHANVIRALQEDAGLSETLARQITKRTADDLVMTELWQRDLARSIGEPVMTLSEAFTAIIARTAAPADTVGLTEALAAIIVTIKSLADTLGLTESLVAQRLAFQLSKTFQFDALFCTEYDFDAIFTNEFAVEAVF